MKTFIIATVSVLLCLPLTAHAASIGAAQTQGKSKISIGVDQEFMFHRDLKFRKETGYSIDSEYTLENVEINDMYRTMFKANYGIIDNLDIYVRLGATNLKEQDEWYYNGNYDSRQNLTGKYAFAYGAGVKGTYPLANQWLIGIDAQYIRNRNTYSGKWTVNDSPWSGHMTVQEWQIAPYVARKIGNFVPYLGAKYSNLKLLDKGVDTTGGWTTRHKAKNNIGVFLGTDFNINSHLKINIEGRFVDETAMSCGSTYKF